MQQMFQVNTGAIELEQSKIDNVNCSRVINSQHTNRTISYESTEESTCGDDHSEAIDVESIVVNEMLIKEKPLEGDSKLDVTENVDTTALNDACQYHVQKIRWGTIRIRVYPVIPGDHPDTREGPPLTIDWDALTEYTLDVDGYEAKRAPRLKVKGLDMRVGPIDRMNILRSEGVSEEEIAVAIQSAQSARKLRRRTIEPWRRQLFKVEEIKESIVRKVTRVLHPEHRTKLITRY